ncbi:MAG: hypothetical protein LZF60_80005 [Nitrospira sp.]|nr:MAG: hypothetical protein LZF60_80005 [Nitrospira sp.]
MRLACRCSTFAHPSLDRRQEDAYTSSLDGDGGPVQIGDRPVRVGKENPYAGDSAH